MPKTPEGFCTMLMYYDQNTMNLTGDLVKVINKLIRLSGSNDTFKPNDIPILTDTAMNEIENLVADELRSYWLKEISRRVRRDEKYRATKDWKESPECSITSENFIYEIKVRDVDDAIDVMTEVLYGLIPKILLMDDRGFAKRLSSTKKYKEEMDEAVKEATSLRKALQEKEKEIARLNTIVSHKDEELKTLKDKPSGKSKDAQSINQLKEERKSLVKKNEGLLADLNSMCARNQELTEQNNLLCKAQEELLDRIETLQKGDPIDYENARFMFIGGREDTIKALSKLFKKSKFTDTVNVPSRVEMVKGYECIFYLAKNIAHNTVYKYKNLVSKADIKDFYLSGTSVTGILNEIRELYYKSPYRD
jgi:archaellum component FlaC